MSDMTPRPSTDLGELLFLSSQAQDCRRSEIAGSWPEERWKEREADLPFLPSSSCLAAPPPESEPLLAHRNGEGEEALQNKSFLAALTDPTREMTAGEKLLAAVALIVRPSLPFFSLPRGSLRRVSGRKDRSVW